MLHLIHRVTIGLLLLNVFRGVAAGQEFERLPVSIDELQRHGVKDLSDLTKVQFYVSKKIVIRRKLTGEGTTIAGGKITAIGSERFETIVVLESTPGIANGQDKGELSGLHSPYLNIRFDPYTPYALCFDSRQKYTTLPDDHHYRLLANGGWTNNPYAGVLHTHYASTNFDIVEGWDAELLADFRVVHEQSSKVDTLKGIRVDGK